MTCTAPSPAPATASPRLRDPRVAAAFDGVPADRLTVVEHGWAELSRAALMRVIEDLQVAETMRVLVVEPVSGYLPELLGRLAAMVTVVSADAGRAALLRQQFLDIGAANVEVVDAVPAAGVFDRLVVMQPPAQELPPELLDHLAERGAAVWVVDAAMPPTQLRRYLRLGDSATLTEDIDLVTLRPLLGDLLVEAGVALRQEISAAVRESGSSGRRLGEELLVRGSVREVDLYRVLAEQQGVPFVRAAEVLARIDPVLLELLPRRFLDFHMFLPIARVDGRVHVATPDVSLAVDEISSMFDDAPVEVELISPTDLQRVWVAIELGLVASRRLSGAQVASGVVAEQALPAPVAPDQRLAELLSVALQQRAESVHVEGEQGAGRARVRFRVDGELVEVAGCDAAAVEVAGLVAAAREVQGQACAVAGRRIRIAVHASEHAATPSFCLRIREQDEEPLHLDQLGHSEGLVAGLRSALAARRGLVLVAGPARSGRSTTLRAAYAELLRDETRRVVWIADGDGAADERELVEALRSAVQQEADAVCLDADIDGRDDLMQAAFGAVRRGMLVLMTTFGSDAADVLQSLKARGVDGHAIASDFAGVVVQHLARRICDGCRRRQEVRDEEVRAAFPNGLSDAFRGSYGVGCEHCGGRGYRGRLPIGEFLPFGPAVRRALRCDVGPHDLTPIARQNGLSSLLDNALALAAAGELSLAEICRVLSEEQRELAGNYAPLSAACS